MTVAHPPNDAPQDGDDLLIAARELFDQYWEAKHKVDAHDPVAYGVDVSNIAPQPADRLVIPVGLLEAITARLDAIEQRLTALEQPRPHVTVSHPTGSPPQPIVIVTYPEDLGD